MYRQDSRPNRQSPFSHKKKNNQQRSRSRSPLSKSPSSRSFTSRTSSSFSGTSDHLWASLEDFQIFPSFCLELLKNEDKYIRRFKTVIQNEKKKINAQMETLTSQVMHSVEDFRLSLLASVDHIYKLYLQKFSQFRSDLIQINRMKEEITLDTYPKHLRNPEGNRRNSSISNEHTIQSIETSHEEFKKYHIMKYISDLQRQKLLPVKEVGEQLLILTQYENGFFVSEEFKQSTVSFIQNIRFSCHDLLKKKYQYFRQPENLFMKEKKILNEASFQDPPEEVNFSKKHEQNPQSYQQNEENRIDFTLYDRTRKTQPEPVDKNMRVRDYYMMEEDSFNSHSVKQLPTDIKLQMVRSITSQSPQIILCAAPIRDNIIVVGSKDGSLMFYDQNGKKVKHSQDHRSSLCTLGLVNNDSLLVSGSDHPHPEIFVWDTRSLEIKAKFKQHKAAVTGIQCLKDGMHMVSGSYDKKICIYNYWQKLLKYTLPSNKSSVTGLLVNKDGSKMVSCGLDNTINVWQIVKRENMVETMFLEQVIQNNVMICSLTNSPYHKNIIYIGTKDGKLKMIDIERGQSIKSISCSNNAIIQLCPIQTSNLQNPFILAWPCKQKTIRIVNTSNSKISTVPTKGYVEFSCGVGPKACLFGHNGMCVVSQGSDREITFYEVQNKR